MTPIKMKNFSHLLHHHHNLKHTLTVILFLLASFQTNNTISTSGFIWETNVCSETEFTSPKWTLYLVINAFPQGNPCWQTRQINSYHDVVYDTKWNKGAYNWRSIMKISCILCNEGEWDVGNKVKSPFGGEGRMDQWINCILSKLICDDTHWIQCL